REAQSRAPPDLLSGKEWIEDTLLEPGRNPGPGIGERHLHRPGAHHTRHANRCACRVGYRIARVGQQVDEYLLQLDGIAYDHRLLRAQVDRDLDRAQPELFPHQGKRPLDHLPQGDGLAANGSRPPERAQVRDDRRGLADLLHGVAQLADDLPLLRDGELDQVDGIADEQPDVVEWIVEL